MIQRAADRFTVIDAFKAIASQLIVLHHLAAYGPISAAVQQLLPGVMDWLYDYARMAVQVFFVIGGYLAARTLFMRLSTLRMLAWSLLGRYLRLIIPFICALLLTIVCTFAARQLWSDEFMPEAPDVLQMLAHIVLLHGILDVESLSAGVWYVAVDFQLFVMLALIAGAGTKMQDSRIAFLAIVTVLAASSLFWFNRDSGYDDWAIYFFGAYGIGAMAYCAGRDVSERNWFWLNMAMVISALLAEFRWRILIAAGTATTLFIARRLAWTPSLRLESAITYFGTISYALFLVHFSVLMLVNAVFGWLRLGSPLAGLAGLLVCWLASIVLADLFYRYIEKPAVAYIKRYAGQ